MFDIVGRKVAAVEDGSRSLCSEVVRDGEMHTTGIDVTDVVDGERSVMGNNRPIPAPQGPLHKMIERPDGPLRQSVDASFDSHPVAAIRVIFLGLVGVANLLGLCGGEESTLSGSELCQATLEVSSISSQCVNLYCSCSMTWLGGV